MAEVFCSRHFTMPCYQIKNKKNNGSFRLAFISDLHNNIYGNAQSELMAALDAAEPDIILLGGDILDEKRITGAGYTLMERLKGRRVFYVTGNHEMRIGNIELIKKNIRKTGVQVLCGRWQRLTVNGCQIVIGGTDDPAIGQECYYRQLAKLDAAPVEECFSILLEHRPERVREYLALHFDLMLAGHAHGGQWRIPGVVNGFFAPHQGFFPKYAGGEYDFGRQTMIVGRGLENFAHGIPRINDPMELVIIDVKP